MKIIITEQQEKSLIKLIEENGITDFTNKLKIGAKAISNVAMGVNKKDPAEKEIDDKNKREKLAKK